MLNQSVVGEQHGVPTPAPKHNEAQAAVQAGLALDPSFTIRRFRTGTATDDAIYLAGRERIYRGLQMAGAPEG